MHKRTTHFEQIALATVREIVEGQIRLETTTQQAEEHEQYISEEIVQGLQYHPSRWFVPFLKQS